jgi:hypothetical protein
MSAVTRPASKANKKLHLVNEKSGGFGAVRQAAGLAAALFAS